MEKPARDELLNDVRLRDAVFGGLYSRLRALFADYDVLENQHAKCADEERIDRKQIKQWQDDSLAWRKRAEKAEAKLAKAEADRERLDWADSVWGGANAIRFDEPSDTIREAIDAAREET
jgi:hypothetical protein